jgi:tRNA threonylcarbamoyl adenosine modification protein (Sua5/YciO/YrdC/YwlC family)
LWGLNKEGEKYDSNDEGDGDMIIKINPENPQQRLIRKVADTLKEGGVIAYPTDTIIICADLKDISNYAYVPDYAYRTMKTLIPGPYTFILEATKLVPKIMLTNQKTLGIRVPDNTISLALVRELEHPIITTSVTKPDEGLYNDPEEIDQMFGRQLDMVVDGGIIVAEHSSIIDLTEESPQVLRSGKGDVSFITEGA